MANKSKSKKNSAAVKEEKAGFSPSQIKKFIDEVNVEFKKIVWPDRKVTLSLTGIVVVLSLIISAYLGSVDFLLGNVISRLLQ